MSHVHTMRLLHKLKCDSSHARLEFPHHRTEHWGAGASVLKDSCLSSIRKSTMTMQTSRKSSMIFMSEPYLRLSERGSVVWIGFLRRSHFQLVAGRDSSSVYNLATYIHKQHVLLNICKNYIILIFTCYNILL